MSETGSADEWNGDEAQHWVTEADRYDGQLAPFGDLLFDCIQLGPDETVLDVGCGCGATTIGAARLAAAAVGIDLSVPMLAVGPQRARIAGVSNIEFVADDAGRHQFATESFDAIISRFGVMFFDDPVMAFTNLRHALRVGGRLAFVCWQGLEANPRNGCLVAQRVSRAVSESQAWKPPTRSVARCSPTSRRNAAARLDW